MEFATPKIAFGKIKIHKKTIFEKNVLKGSLEAMNLRKVNVSKDTRIHHRVFNRDFLFWGVGNFDPDKRIRETVNPFLRKGPTKNWRVPFSHPVIVKQMARHFIIPSKTQSFFERLRNPKETIIVSFV